MFNEIQTIDITIDFEKLVKVLKTDHAQAITHIKGINPSDRDQVLERFSKEDKRDTFYTHYRQFEKSLDSVMPEPEAQPFLEDFENLTIAITHIRNFLNDGKFSTKPYSGKIQKIIDDCIAAGKIKIPIEGIEYDDENFAAEIKEMKNTRAQNAALTTRIGKIIRMKRPDNPVFYSSLEERLNEIIQAEKEQRIDALEIFEGLSAISKESQEEDERIKELGLENGFEFAVYGKIKEFFSDQSSSVKTCKEIFEKISPLTEFVDWEEKVMVRKDMEKSIYEILSKNNFPEDKIDAISVEIIDLAKRHMK